MNLINYNSLDANFISLQQDDFSLSRAQHGVRIQASDSKNKTF